MTAVLDFPRPARAGAGVRAPGRAGVAPWAWVATAVLFASLLAAVLGPVMHGAPAVPEDDAEYYRVIAGHLARTGVSTFDGQSLTNGYHPLWQWMLALQDRLFGPSFLLTQLLEVVLVTAAFPLLLRATGLRSPLGVAVFLALFGRLVAGLALTGMELSLLVFTVGLLAVSAERHARGLAPDRWSQGVALGLAAAAAVLARIDAAVFVGPLVLFAPLERRTRITALATAGVIGGAYAGYNLVMFGAALPLSSAVKSLGGLQLNHRVLDEVAADWRAHHLMSRYVQTLGLLALSPLALAAAWGRPHARALAAAALVGGALFVGKIVFASSWRVWPWYNFPVLFGLLAAAAAFGPPLEAGAGRLFARRRHLAPAARVLGLGAAGVLLAALGAKAALTAARPPPASLNDFAALDVRAARVWAPVLRGQRVAMGDRAGAFASAYDGPVVQLEGLVNDREYLAALRRGGDVTALLCRRGVRFVLAYRPDLGDYATHRMPVMRTALTQFAGPVVTLSRLDEVGHMRDRGLLDLRGVDEEDDTLYLWRLGACARAG